MEKLINSIHFFKSNFSTQFLFKLSSQIKEYTFAPDEIICKVSYFILKINYFFVRKILILKEFFSF